jgi:type I restriction enzyme S subunit
VSEFPKLRLSDLCDKITDGTHHSPKNSAVGQFKYITAKNIKPWGLDLTDLTFVDEATHREIYARCDVQRNDILYIKDGATTGVAVINPLEEQFSLLSSVGVFRPGSAVAPKYLLYALQDPGTKAKMMDGVAGVAITRLTLKKLGAAEIPVAPRAAQDRIVEKLEELLSDLDAGVAELKAAQKKLAQYRQSLLKAALEGSLTAEWRAKHPSTETGAQLLERILQERRARWEAKQLAKFEEQGKAPPKGWQAKYPEPVQPDTTGLPALPEGWVWASVDQLTPDDLANGRSVPSADNGAKVLRLTAVRDGHIDLTASKSGAWTEDEARQFWVTEGDLLIVRGNGSLSLVGRAGLVPEVVAPVAYPDTLIRLRVLNAVVNPAWIGAIWDSSFVRKHIELRARTSAGIYKISQPDIVSAVVPVPPISEQRAAMAEIETLKTEAVALTNAIDLGLQQSAAQRQNILRAAFAGQLVPQDPNDEPASVLLERIRAERAARDAVSKPRGRKPKEAA